MQLQASFSDAVAWNSMPETDLIDVAEVNAALAAGISRPGGAGGRFAGYVEHSVRVDSTNRLALDAAQRGVITGVWVADEQTAGRGRGGHTWHSAAGEGLYVSALVAPQLPAQYAMWLPLAAGLAAQQAIDESCGLHVDLRWPNDLILHGGKCGGILVETSSETPRSAETSWLRHAVIGIGINVNHREFPPDLADLATSLSREHGATFMRQPLLLGLLCALDTQITLLENEVRQQGTAGKSSTPAGLLERFSKASTWVRGRRVQVPEGGGYTGTTAGLDPRGFLLVDTEEGERRTVLSGGVRDAL